MPVTLTTQDTSQRESIRQVITCMFEHIRHRPTAFTSARLLHRCILILGDLCTVLCGDQLTANKFDSVQFHPFHTYSSGARQEELTRLLARQYSCMVQ